MSTQSNRKWTRVDARRALAHEFLELWLAGHQEVTLQRMEAHPQARRLLAAMVAVALEPGHGDRYTEAMRAISDRIYRER